MEEGGRREGEVRRDSWEIFFGMDREQIRRRDDEQERNLLEREDRKVKAAEARMDKEWEDWRRWEEGEWRREIGVARERQDRWARQRAASQSLRRLE